MVTTNRPEDLFDLTGKTAIVSGSSRGIGLGIVQQFCQAGAKCIISSENTQDVEHAVKLMKAQGHDVLGVTCDVTNASARQQLIETTKSNSGRLDILVCNAGIPGQAGPMTEMNMEESLRVFDVNLHSMVGLTQAAFPMMKAQASGSIILMSSIAGLRGNAALNAYAMAKAGVSQLARNLAVQWGPYSIRANSISPGLIKTDLSTQLLANEAFMKRRLQMTPLRCTGDIQDVASCALFLASNAAKFITGHNLVVDGGTTITDGS